MIFILFISAIILIRLAELWYSKKNERWLLKNHAVEYGKKHYPFIVIMHSLFILSLWIEYELNQDKTFSLVFFLIYVFLMGLKYWVIASLGKYWNTKIYRIKGHSLIKKGPYLYVKHPNYLIVIGEIIVIPMVFHLYFTAIFFSFLNAIMLFVRIKEENKALAE